MDFESLKNNLQILDGSDRTSYLIDLAKKSHGIPTHEKNDENRIWGCASISYIKIKNIDPFVHINTDSESVLVKGLLFILDCYVNGKNTNEILSINEKELMEEIGMKIMDPTLVYQDNQPCIKIINHHKTSTSTVLKTMSIRTARLQEMVQEEQSLRVQWQETHKLVSDITVSYTHLRAHET